MIRRAQKKTAIALISVGMLVAGCSSSGNGGATQGGSQGGSATSSTASGLSPIKVMTITHINTQTISYPESKVGAEAAVKAINAAGGVKGHPLDLTVCDDQNDPNLSLQCAHRAVEGKFAALVGSFEVFPGVFTYLDQQKFPFVFGPGEVAPEVNISNSFPINAGVSFGQGVGVLANMLAKGSTKIAFLDCTGPGCKDTVQRNVDSLAKAGLKPIHMVDAPTGGADFTSQITQAMQGAGAIDLISYPGDTVKQLKTLHQLGFTGLIGVTGGQISQADITALGNDAPAPGKLLISGGFKSINDVSDPTIAKFVSEMDAVDSTAVKDELALIPWAAYQLFAELANRLSSWGPADILAAMKSLSNPLTSLGNITAPYKVVGSTPPDGFPQLFNPTVSFNTVKDGKITSTQTGVDPWASLEKHHS